MLTGCGTTYIIDAKYKELVESSQPNLCIEYGDIEHYPGEMKGLLFKNQYNKQKIGVI